MEIDLSEENGKRRRIDLSHRIEDGMTTYPGLPGPRISDFWSRESTRGKYSEGTTFQIGEIDMIANTGTYLDAPFHRYKEGADVGSLPLEKLTDLPGLVVDATGRPGRALDAPLFTGKKLRGRAVLISTGWDVLWRTPEYIQGHPYLTRAAAELLVEENATLVGIDSVNIDDVQDLSRPAHTLLLAAGIPIVEHLTGLTALPPEGFRFHAVPAPVSGLGSFPVRAYALV
jgi:kynurenine formamidase